MQYIDDVFVNVDPTGEDTGGTTDCGAIAVSTIEGISVQQNYCTWDNPTACPFYGAGISVAVDKTVPDSGTGPLGTYRYFETNHLRQIAVSYDGSAPAGTTGAVNIYKNDEYGNPVVYLGSINVYIHDGTPPTTWFTATSSSTNISGDSFYLDHPLLNGNVSAKVFITHVLYGTNHNHPTAITYDGIAGKWKIRNEDGFAMPSGLTFNVRIDPSALGIRTASSGTVTSLVINHPEANGNPYATIIVTPNSRGTRRLTHPIAVKYIAPYWRIVASDGANLPNSNPFTGDLAAFYVKVIGASQYADDYIVGDTSGLINTDLSNGAGVDINGPYRVSGNKKYLSVFCFTTGGLSPVIVTPNLTPLPPPAPRNYSFVEAKYVGVWTSGPNMYVYHEDGSVMPAQAAFNVWGAPLPACDPTY